MTVDTLGRAFGVYRRTMTSRSAIVLLVANAIPLLGVAFFGWSLLTILVLYWLENGIVGFWNVPKIIMAQGSMVPTIPNLPDAAALAATGDPGRAAELQAQWRRAQELQAVPAAGATAATGMTTATGATAATGTTAIAGAPAAADPNDAAALSATTTTADPNDAAALSATTLSAAIPAGVTTAAATAPGPTASARPMTILGPKAAARLSAIPRVVLAIFFSFHYGMFWFVHGIFVFALPAFGTGFGAGAPCLDGTSTLPGVPLPPDLAGICEAASPFGTVVWSNVLLAAVALFLSHGASFVLNYIGRGEYITATAPGQMGSVYGRVVVLHLTIIFGSMLVAFLGAPIAALVVLVVLKTAFDLRLHLRQHRAAGPVPAMGPPIAA